MIGDLKNNDEIFFDLIEYLDYKVDRHGNVVFSEVNGEIKIESLLTGANKVKMFFSQAKCISECSAHECILDS